MCHTAPRHTHPRIYTPHRQQPIASIIVQAWGEHSPDRESVLWDFLPLRRPRETPRITAILLFKQAFSNTFLSSVPGIPAVGTFIQVQAIRIKLGRLPVTRRGGLAPVCHCVQQHLIHSLSAVPGRHRRPPAVIRRETLAITCDDSGRRRLPTQPNEKLLDGKVVVHMCLHDMPRRYELHGMPVSPRSRY